MIELHIPEGINYECTGCGKCCSGWAVPLTTEDYDRISEKDWAVLHDKYRGKRLFRELRDYETADSPYTHAIIRGEDGHCPFLVDNLCFIHKNFGAKAKPAICQLFPYCFNETPSGVYATVSFYSAGVVYNSGKALVEQANLLRQKWEEFRALNPDHHPNWSVLNFAVGQPMTWDEYLKHEGQLLACLKDQSLSMEQRMLRCSQYLVSQLPSKPAAPLPDGQPFLKRLDRHLLVALHKLYFPVKPLGRGEGDFNTFRFLYQVAFQSTKIPFPGRSYTFEELKAVPWPDRDPEIEDLLYRYFFSRVFGKLYFGAGFGQLSLLAGFHHLILALALVKVQSKALAAGRGAPAVSFMDVAATIRQLEKRMGETKLGGYGAAIWELLMSSAQRVRRVIAYI